MSQEDSCPDALEGRGRLVMYGGDAYEDDVEPADDEPSRGHRAAARPHSPGSGTPAVGRFRRCEETEKIDGPR